MKYLTIVIAAFLLSSCGRSAESYQEEIEDLNSQIEDLQSEITELQSKLDNIASIASDGEIEASYAQDEDYSSMNDALYECQSKFEEIESEASY